MPLPDEVEALKNIAVPATKNQLQNFMGLMKYNKDMWKHRSGILTPSSSMTSKQARWDES